MSVEKEHTVGFFDRLLGREAQEPRRQYSMAQHSPSQVSRVALYGDAGGDFGGDCGGDFGF